VVYRPVPTYLYHRIGPPPVGCRYIDIDGDILLVALTTGLIMDILYNE
jgi:Ni/Co efflux regulator RcnB